MRVLIFHDGPYLPETAGGAESSNHAICERLIRRGIECAVLCGVARGKPISWMHRGLGKLSLRYVPDNIMGYPVYRCWSPEACMAGAIEAFRPDVVVMQKVFHGAAARTVQSYGIPCVYFVRDVEFLGLDFETIETLGVTLLANSRFTVRRIQEVSGLRAEVVLPVVESERYIVDRPGTRVVFVNPVVKKGVDVALALAEARPDVDFLFVESWPLTDAHRQKLQSRLQSLPNVTLTGPVEDMRPVYAAAKVLLAPSQWEEAWGRVVTEAHFSGIPVLASSRGALPESVGPGGIIVPYDASIDAWLEALSALWDDPIRHGAVGAAAARYARRDEIKPEVIIDKLANILRIIARTGEVAYGAMATRSAGARDDFSYERNPALRGAGIADRRIPGRTAAQDVSASL